MPLKEIAKGSFGKSERKSKIKIIEKELNESLITSKGEEWLNENKTLVFTYFEK